MKKSFKLHTFLIAVFVYCGLLFPADLVSAPAKDVILVLDTSLSMRGFGGKNIFEDVKQSVTRYIETLEDGDRVTLISFDTDAKIYPPMLVDDDNDRDILKKFILMTESNGKWTHMLKMMQSVFRKAEEIDAQKESRQIVIIIMTDGLDDPPPWERNKRFNIGRLANEYQGKDWWIYLVNYKDLQNNEALRKYAQTVKAELGKVASKVELIDASGNPSDSIDGALAVKIEEDESYSGVLLLIVVLLIIAGSVLGFLFFLRRRGEQILAGRLEFWNNDLLVPQTESVDISKYITREFVIGNKFGCNLNLRDLEVHGPVIIKSKRVRGELKYTIIASGADTIDFKNRESGLYIENGDIFVIANYTFKFYMD